MVAFVSLLAVHKLNSFYHEQRRGCRLAGREGRSQGDGRASPGLGSEDEGPTDACGALAHVEQTQASALTVFGVELLVVVLLVLAHSLVDPLKSPVFPANGVVMGLLQPVVAVEQTALDLATPRDLAIPCELS